MLDDLRDLAAAIAGGSSKVTARLAALAVFAIVADVLLLRALMEGLELRHAGLPTGGAVIKAVVALASTCLVTRGLYVEVATRSADLAKAQVQRIAAALPRLPLVEIDALNRGALLTRILGDSNVVASESRELLRATSGMLRLVIGSLFVLVISQTAFAVAVVGVILIAITAIGRVIMVRDGISRVADDDASFYDRLREQIDGAVPIRLSRDRSAAIAAELEALSIRRRVIRTEIFTRFYANQYVEEAIVYGLLGAYVFVLPFFGDADAQAIRDIVLLTLWMIYGAVQLVFCLPAVTSATQALTRLAGLEALLAEERLEPAATDDDVRGGPLRDFQTIRVEGVTFTYPATEGHDGFTLGPLDLTIRRGDVVFLTGANGSGKSTFGRLLAGLYRPAAGRICADGVPITDARLGAWRALFATVFVEHRTLATLYGVEEQALERAPALLGELELADKTAIVDGRVTNLGLSTGQSKRLALVLTRLQGKPILVLDEWAAEQDPEHRAWFYDELLPALRAEGRTVIVITHDDQYFDRADWRLVMTAGRIASGDR